MKDVILIAGFLGLYGYGYFYLKKLTDSLGERRKKKEHEKNLWK